MNDVHVRYEDPSAGISPFCLGLMVSSISVQSTDENWVSTVSIKLEYFAGENLREFPKLMNLVKKAFRMVGRGWSDVCTYVHICIMHTHTHAHTHTHTHTLTHTRMSEEGVQEWL